MERQYTTRYPDPYNGSDDFKLKLTDGEGAITEVTIEAHHNGSGSGVAMRAMNEPAMPIAQEAPAHEPPTQQALTLQEAQRLHQNPWMLAAAEILRDMRVQNQFEAWTSAQHAEPVGRHVPVGPADVSAAMQELQQAQHDILLSSGGGS